MSQKCHFVLCSNLMTAIFILQQEQINEFQLMQQFFFLDTNLPLKIFSLGWRISTVVNISVEGNQIQLYYFSAWSTPLHKLQEVIDLTLPLALKYFSAYSIGFLSRIVPINLTSSSMLLTGFHDVRILFHVLRFLCFQRNLKCWHK